MLSQFCVLTLGTCCPWDPSQHKTRRDGVVWPSRESEKQCSNYFLAVEFVFFPHQQNFWHYVLLVMANKDDFFRIKKMHKGCSGQWEFFWGENTPCWRKSPASLCCVGGVRSGTFSCLKRRKDKSLQEVSCSPWSSADQWDGRSLTT